MSELTSKNSAETPKMLCFSKATKGHFLPLPLSKLDRQTETEGERENVWQEKEMESFNSDPGCGFSLPSSNRTLLTFPFFRSSNIQRLMNGIIDEVI